MNLIISKKKITKISIRKMKEAGIERLPLTLEQIVGKVLFDDIYDEETGEVIASANEALTSRLGNVAKKDVSITTAFG